jgi:hypothetical protein
MKFPGLEFFEKEELDQSVLVPLSQAKRHKVVEAEYARRHSEEQKHQGALGDGKDTKDGSESEEGVMRMSSLEYSPYTIEGLRAEVMEDMKTNGYDTAYDSEFCNNKRDGVRANST